MKISDITTVVTGGTPSTKNKAFWENGTIPWLQSGVCKNGCVDTCSKYITQAGLDNSSAKMMPAGTVIIALTGATVGKVGLLRIEACANQSVTGIIPNDSFLPLYMFYYLLSIRGKIIHDSYGDAQPHISQQYVKDIDIPLPSLAEQEKIVEWIEELFSELDSGVETLNKTKAQLVVYRQAVLKEAFATCGIKKPIRETSSIVTSGSRGWAQYYSDSGARFIRIGNLTRNTIKIKLDDMQYVQLPSNAEGLRTRLQPNDVLVSITADLGSIGLVPKDIGEAYVNQHIAMVRFNKSEQGELYAWYLRSEYGQKDLLKNKRGGGKLGLGLDDIRDTPVPDVSDDEANRIVSNIESCLSVCDSIEQTVNIALQQAEAMRQSILKQAFEGRL